MTEGKLHKMGRIGWVGLGQIGTQMVLRLRARGRDVTVYGRGGGLDEAAAAGAGVTHDYRALAAHCDMLFLCVYSEEQIRDVLLAQGAMAAMRPGSLLVVHTTASPALLRDIVAQARTGKVEVLDACFSGGPADVAAGRLTIMAGGSEEALNRALPALGTYAVSIERVGTIGQGQTVKLLNNLLFATNLMNAAHLLGLAQAHGLHTGPVAAILQRSSGSSFAMDLFARADAEPAAVLGQIRHYLEKDVASAAAAAKSANIDISAFSNVMQFFEKPGAATQS